MIKTIMPLKKNKFTAAVGAIFATSCILMSSSMVYAGETDWSGFFENATYARDGVGISKFRNTFQAEFTREIDSKSSWSNIRISGTLRGTYDGVYDLNEDEFGVDAREPYLGSNFHDRGPAAALLSPGVPFPCENDPLLCSNLDGYQDEKEDDAILPEFNDQLDALRELYISADKNFKNGDILNISFGRQQVVWGKTDLFRVLDVINPVDYSRHNIYDELEDIRIPQLIFSTEWRMGPTKRLDDSNLSFVWNLDEFRPNNLGTCGQAYRILDAGCFFAAYINLGDFSAADMAPFNMLYTANENPPIIHDVEDPEWNLSNTQFGLKWEGVYQNLTFSLNALHYRQQLPSLHFRPHPDNPMFPARDGVFDIRFPRVNLLGGSFDYYAQAIDSVWRFELAYTQGEEFPRDMNGHNETDIVRYVLGFDKNQIIGWLGTPSAFLISAQIFGEHILDHEADMPNEENNWIATLLFKGFYKNNRLSPQIIIAHDIGGEATVVAPSVSWIPGNHWLFNFGLNIKEGGDQTFPWSVAMGAETFEPLARFTNGPIGVANREDELQITIRYSF